MSLSYNGYGLADVAINGLVGTRIVGGYCLTFNVRFSPKVLHDPISQASEVQDLRLKVSLETECAPPTLIGHTTCNLHRSFIVNKYQQAEYRQFDLVLSDGQLAAMEAMRGSGGIVFKGNLGALAIGNRGPWPTEAELRWECNLSDWTKLLASMGAAEYLCVPVLLPTVGQTDPHAPALARVRSAQKFMIQGEYQTVVAECRQALELLTKLQEAELAIDAANALSENAIWTAFKTGRKSMSRAQRLAMVRMSLYHLANLAHHPVEGSTEGFGREDAAVVLASTAGLLSAWGARHAAASAINSAYKS